MTKAAIASETPNMAPRPCRYCRVEFTPRRSQEAGRKFCCPAHQKAFWAESVRRASEDYAEELKSHTATELQLRARIAMLERKLIAMGQEPLAPMPKSPFMRSPEVRDDQIEVREGRLPHYDENSARTQANRIFAYFEAHPNEWIGDVYRLFPFSRRVPARIFDLRRRGHVFRTRCLSVDKKQLYEYMLVVDPEGTEG